MSAMVDQGASLKAARTGARPARVRLDPLVAVCVGPAAASAAIIVAGQVITTVSDRPPLVVVVTAGALLALGIALVSLGPRTIGRIRIGRPTLRDAALASLFLVSAALVAQLTFHLAFFSPTTYTVDAAHHAAIVRWIVDSASLPVTDRFRLGSWNSYPTWSHLIPALVSKATGLQPITAMWLVALAAVFLQWPLTAVLVRSVRPSTHWAFSVIPSVLMLLAWRYTIGLVTWDFFYSQLFGLFLSVAAVVVMAVSWHQPSRRWVPLTIVLGLASLLCYPQQGAIVPAAMLGVFCARRRQRLPRRSLVALVMTTSVVVLGVIAWLRSRNYFNSGVILGASEGEVALPSTRTLGGWIPAVLALLGFLLLARATARRNGAAGALLGAGMAPLTLAFALVSVKHGYPVQIHVTSYRIAKNIYSAVPFGAAAGAVALAAAFQTTSRGRSRVAFVLSSIVLLAVASRPKPLSGVSTQVAQRDAYELTRWAAHHLPSGSVGIVGPGLEPYTLWNAALWSPTDTPRDASGFYTLIDYLAGGTGLGALSGGRSVRWADWPAGTTTEEYLLASGDGFAARYGARVGVAVVRRNGHAVLFRRVDSGGPTASAPLESVTGQPQLGAAGLP